MAATKSILSMRQWAYMEVRTSSLHHISLPTNSLDRPTPHLSTPSIPTPPHTQLGDDRAIEFIAMASPEDLNANAEFVRLADRFVEVPGGTFVRSASRSSFRWAIVDRQLCFGRTRVYAPRLVSALVITRTPQNRSTHQARTRTTTRTWT